MQNDKLLARYCIGGSGSLELGVISQHRKVARHGKVPWNLKRCALQCDATERWNACRPAAGVGDRREHKVCSDTPPQKTGHGASERLDFLVLGCRLTGPSPSSRRPVLGQC